MTAGKAIKESLISNETLFPCYQEAIPYHDAATIILHHMDGIYR